MRCTVGVLLLVFPIVLIAQNKVAILDDAGTNPGLVIDELRPKAPDVTGTFYIADEWQPGNVHLNRNRSLKNYPLKYDLEHNILEINTKEGIKICPLATIETFEWINRNGDTLRFFNSGILPAARSFGGAALFERVADGKALLLAYYQTEVLAPVYVTGIDMGRKDHKIVQKVSYYLAVGNELFMLHSNRDKNKLAFGTYAEQVVDYARKNQLRFTNRNDLIRIIVYFNSLL